MEVKGEEEEVEEEEDEEEEVHLKHGNHYSTAVLW